MAEQQKVTVLRLHKHADKSTGHRITKFDPETGEKRLVNPATPGDEHESWPLAGVSFQDDEPPKLTTITPAKITEGQAEKWLTVEGANPVIRPAGPTQDVWASTQTGLPHLFMHYDAVVFSLVDGTHVRYKVIENPDKFADDTEYDRRGRVVKGNSHNNKTKVNPTVYADGQTRVDHFYVLELVEG